MKWPGGLGFVKTSSGARCGPTSLIADLQVPRQGFSPLLGPALRVLRAGQQRRCLRRLLPSVFESRGDLDSSRRAASLAAWLPDESKENVMRRSMSTRLERAREAYEAGNLSGLWDSLVICEQEREVRRLPASVPQALRRIRRPRCLRGAVAPASTALLG